MQGLEAPRLDVCSTFLAGSIEALIEAMQSLLDDGELILGGIVDHLQGLVVLQLNGTIAPIADQKIIAAPEVPRDAGVTPFQGAASGDQQMLDLAEVLSWI